MSLHEETRRLQQQLRQLAGEADADLARRYPLRRPFPPATLSLYRRLRMAAGRILRRLGLRRTPPAEPWLPTLKHDKRGEHGENGRHSEPAEPLVIWALGMDRDTLRAACRGLEKRLDAQPGLAPVLITDVADFAFFSRLGWLVEYVPTLSPPAGGYARRKQRYLAWRYRGAQALPATAGLTEGVRRDAPDSPDRLSGALE